MASPPRNPGPRSPPYPNPLALPQSRKRASSGLSISSNMPSAKRRKSTLHSIASTPGGSHPLRQTSFPPEESTLDPSVVRSPSIDSDITAATGARSIATTATVAKGRRGRKRKAEGSVVSGKNTVRPSVEGNSAKGGGDDAEEEEDDEDGEMGFVNQGEVVDKDTEKENLALVSSTTYCCFHSELDMPAESLSEHSMRTKMIATRSTDERSSIKINSERSEQLFITVYQVF